jgi:hypothetical protein
VAPRTRPATVAFASLIGTSVEYYDFFIYATAAALVFNRLFFPAFDPTVGTLLSLATFAVGFVARPLGGSCSATSGTGSAASRCWCSP